MCVVQGNESPGQGKRKWWKQEMEKGKRESWLDFGLLGCLGDDGESECFCVQERKERGF